MNLSMYVMDRSLKSKSHAAILPLFLNHLLPLQIVTMETRLKNIQALQSITGPVVLMGKLIICTPTLVFYCIQEWSAAESIQLEEAFIRKLVTIMLRLREKAKNIQFLIQGVGYSMIRKTLGLKKYGDWISTKNVMRLKQVHKNVEALLDLFVTPQGIFKLQFR